MTQKRRLAWALALLFVVNIAVISLAQQAEAATYRQGSSGEQVRIIQTKLKNWGYYDARWMASTAVRRPRRSNTFSGRTA